MKKWLKYCLMLLVTIIGIIFINGCYYVFCGQEKSIKKLQQGKELNLYECCSIYSIHTAIWMFGWTVSPEAAQQAFYMTQPPKNRTIINSYFVTPKETLRYKLAFPNDLKIEVETYDDWFYDLLGNEIRSTQKFYYCSRLFHLKHAFMFRNVAIL